MFCYICISLYSCHFFFSSKQSPSTTSNPRLSAAAPAVAAGQCLLAEPPCCPYSQAAACHFPLATRCWQRYNDHIVNIVSGAVVSHVVMELPCLVLPLRPLLLSSSPSSASSSSSSSSAFLLPSFLLACCHPAFVTSSSCALNLMTKVRRAGRCHASPG